MCRSIWTIDRESKLGIRNEQEARAIGAGMDWKLTAQENEAIEQALAGWR